MAKTIDSAVREVCLSFPEAEEFLSHGAPNFRVRGKTFASYAVNHHGDGRVALWLNAPSGAQEQHCAHEPTHFFIPPYVGPRGWLGVNLDKGLSWQRIAALVRSAYETSAPPALVRGMGPTIRITPPAKTLSPAQMDPMLAAPVQLVLKQLRDVCLALPEVVEDRQFGSPVWRAGKRTFAQAWMDAGKLTLGFWVGIEQQGLYTSDPRFRIPMYLGHNGWIALDVSRRCNWKEVRSLALHSYRHFALKRMLAALDE
ncbi:MmcQ/YjbR family DNA-binding protein [Tahibacter amnicola]|uniref:MmcQ/YjbR family DNA-binding protein n=1 Tax=Tahibacter amnicola TaxID=2976241 RepID=A0ABY6BMA6_9GAMM|nr:MmcQ/YjbR family DNA-binding protein [Tahibacter amnicola]UXI70190.1 MmcQ/YjbR family DNA-binding protein [Tahibacter amnicola]